MPARSPPASALLPVAAGGYRFDGQPVPLSQFADSFAKVAALPCDIVLTPHPTSSAMPSRSAAHGGLHDPAGCRNYAQAMRDRLANCLASEGASG